MADHSFSNQNSSNNNKCYVDKHFAYLHMEHKINIILLQVLLYVYMLTK